MTRAVQRIALGSAFLLVLGWGQPKANAQVTILHSFGDGTVPNDGALPLVGLIQAPDGNFYGCTVSTATVFERKQGTVFQMTTGGTVTTIQTFTKGSYISYPVVYDDGKLIAIVFGAVSTNSKLFGLTKSANGVWSKKAWYSFTLTNGGPILPAGNPILATDGDLYGVSSGGGSNKLGVVYNVNPSTHQLKTISNFTFGGLASGPNTALFQATDGNFYGGTNAVAAPGKIFKVTPAGEISTFYTFSTIAIGLVGPLIQGSDGNFYGAAGILVFQLKPDGTFKVLHTFGQGTDGKGPAGAVAQGPNGNLYGLCVVGGTAGNGTIYEISTDGSSYSVLHNFGDGSVPNDGQNPSGSLLLGADNNFYGTTEFGGSARKGTIFKVSP